MTIFELLSWLVLGPVVGVLVAAFWPTEGLTFIRSLAVGMFGALVGGLIGQTLFVARSGELGIVTPSLGVAALGAVVMMLIARFQLRNRERPHLT